MEVKLGNMAEDLPRGRKFQHPGITVYGGTAQMLSGITYNFQDLYRDLSFASSLGHDAIPIQPTVALYIAFCQGVEDLTLHSPAFLGMDDVTFGGNVYNEDTIGSRSEVYANRPETPKTSIVGFLSESYVTEALDDMKVAQWRRVNRVLNRNQELREYDAQEHGDAKEPPERNPLVAYVPDPQSRRSLEYIINYAQSRRYQFVDDTEPGLVYLFPLGRTLSDSTQMDNTVGYRNIATAHSDQVAVERNPQLYMSGYRIQFGLMTLLTASGIASSNRSGTTIAELGMSDIKFTFPVFYGTTINDVRSEVVDVHDHPSNRDFATAVTYKITARGYLPKYIREVRDSGRLEIGPLKELFSRLHENERDNPQVVSFKQTVLQLKRPKAS